MPQDMENILSSFVIQEILYFIGTHYSCIFYKENFIRQIPL